MKMSQIKKARVRKQPRIRVSFERDYHDRAWFGEIVPTPETHPDAFYRTETVVSAPPAKKHTRLTPHDTLSKRQLSKRVYRAGIRGAELKRIVAEIQAGPGLYLEGGGFTALGWNTLAFQRRFGRRLSKVVLRFVRTSLLMLDEAWALLGSSPGISESICTVLRMGRKAAEAIVPTLPHILMPLIIDETPSYSPTFAHHQGANAIVHPLPGIMVQDDYGWSVMRLRLLSSEISVPL